MPTRPKVVSNFFPNAQLQGWLMKQRHGITKAWLRRYFVLEDRTLRFYKAESDTIPQGSLDLDHYTVHTNIIPLNILRKENPRRSTFCLVSDSTNKTTMPNFFLQADCDESRDIWIMLINPQVIKHTSVLDKWLERLDIQNTSPAPSSPVTTASTATPITPETPTTPATPPSQTALLSPINPGSLRTHRSVESIASLGSASSSIGSGSTATSHKSSFFNDLSSPRRSSNHSSTSLNSTTGNSNISSSSNKFSPSKLFVRWSRSSTKSASPPRPQYQASTPLPSPPLSKETQSPSPFGSRIIHPSEYEHENDSHKEFLQTQKDLALRKTESNSIANRRQIQVVSIPTHVRSHSASQVPIVSDLSMI
ncbi:hypothetical protein J3Q64DRAFT_1016755 [Phycomyces blakesleeanus]|uniref:PH domain-containing protein n=1 Tax=Phycomyces blakesleeanus TaxID=4837 RepID=A0ABR3BFL3_PHYBL